MQYPSCLRNWRSTCTHQQKLRRLNCCHFSSACPSHQVAEYHDFSQEILSRHNQPAEVETESVRQLIISTFISSCIQLPTFKLQKSIQNRLSMLHLFWFSFHFYMHPVAGFQSVRVETEFNTRLSLSVLFKAYSSAKVADFEPREVHTDQSHNYHSHFHSNLNALSCPLPTCASKYRFCQERTAFHFFPKSNTLSCRHLKCGSPRTIN